MIRNRRLDILRGIAILMVLLRHVPPDWVKDFDGWWRSFFDIWINAGWCGVDLFFVLSGFLVSGLLFREYLRDGTVLPFRFLIRRGFKIYPPFYTCLLLVALCFWHRGQVILPQTVLTDAFFLQSYFAGVLPAHTWSLAVEEHFYLFLAVYCTIVTRNTRSQPFANLPMIFLIVAVACLSLRIFTGALFPYGHRTHMFPTHLRMDSLFFGVLVAYGFYFHRSRMDGWFAKRVPVWIVASAILIAPVFFFKDSALATFGLTSVYLGFGIVVCLAFYIKERSVLILDQIGTAIAFCGKHSYSIYLWHLTVQYESFRFLGKLNDWQMICLYLTGSLVVGTIMSYLIETPFLRWRDRILPSRAGNLTLQGDIHPATS